MSPDDPYLATPKIDASASVVDGDDGRHVLHAGKMLNGAGHAHGDVELAGARRLAGLTDLAALGQPARIGDGPGAAERRADGIRQLPELRHLGFLADAAADGQDELGGRHVDVVAGAQAR